MTIGVPEENPALARVRAFAASVRRGLAGEQPQIGVSPVMGRREHLNRLAGEAAAPMLQGGGSPPQDPAAGGGGSPSILARAQGAMPGAGFGQAVSELAKMRGRGRQGQR